MRTSLLEILRCPATGSPLRLVDADHRSAFVESGRLAAESGGHEYPIVNGVPRFVPAENYAVTFGLQWNRFRRTQLDSHTGRSITADRFYRATGWLSADLRGKRVLDIGCGAGRFVEIALAAGADVVAIDYSSAVDACWANHSSARDRLDVIQADIFHLPFEPGSFDFVYCLGVIQHTPDPKRAFRALPAQLKPGGRLALDVYPKLALNRVWPKYWVRPLTRRVAADRLFGMVERWTPRLLPVSRVLGKIPGLGRWLRHAIPIANYDGVLPLTQAQQLEWSVLDTYDMLAPTHDHPQTLGEIDRWFRDAGLTDIRVERHGVIEASGRRSTTQNG